MRRHYKGTPGLAVRELILSDADNTSEMQQGIANVFVKLADPAAHPIPLHEYLASRLAHSMGIPVPFGELADIQSGERAWASAVVGVEGKAAPPGDAAEAATNEPHVFAGICAFDVWVHNVDRTEENIIYSPTAGLWAIDHEKAFGEYNPRDPNTRLRNSRDTASTPFAWGGVKPDQERLKSWLNLIEQNGARWAENALEAAYSRNLLGRETLREYKAFLDHRRSNLRSLTAATYGFEWGTLF